jgi:tRNA pseudouridine65 synthase
VILHRDERVVIVDKPAGVIVHRSFAGDDEYALMQQVRDTVGTLVYPIHRLDRGASGAVAFALDREAAKVLCDGFAAGAADKRYLAITRGHPPEHLVLDYAIPCEAGGARVDAVTELARRETFGRYALVDARPRTGRFHQIRRHLKHLSCPLIGDVKYGKGEHNRLFRERYALHRLALHCYQLTVPHPDGTTITVTAPLPADLDGCLAQLRLDYPAI